MKYFMAWRKKMWPRLKGRKIYLLLDYDGTLAPIARYPDKAVLSPETRVILKKLSKHPQCVLAVISGRSLANIKKMVKIPKIIYSGNHGLEVDYHGVHLKCFEDAGFQVLLGRIQAVLRKKVSSLKGVLLENKKIALAVHYRSVARSQQSGLKSIFAEVIKPYYTSGQVEVAAGKMVLEIRPPLQWGKGDLVNWLLHDVDWGKNKSLVFYFGDDYTDEDAFKILKGKGYSIVVGKKKGSAAEYYLRNTDEVIEVLTQLEQNLGEKLK